jgi:hypothetical protein
MSGKRTRSLGEAISTVSFFGMSAWLVLEALSLIGIVSPLQVFGLFVASLMCLLGGLRFVISDMAAALKRRFW